MAARGHWLGVPLNLVVSLGFLFLGLVTLKNRWSSEPPPIAEKEGVEPAPALPAWSRPSPAASK